ncbi:RING-H2 finger protein ATL43 [Cajanus cajan]|uniref:RING-type E3 ubiquitin transferase n=1 Tax=Cajanus cajan TaxID=3821 RepID=A0A151RUM1_CAJCA|nr:RING-H2 finger protein ATL43 [Cajanus cajan]KYP46240.1 RING-H2 finger protein ATL5C [Cajanus cajan]
MATAVTRRPSFTLFVLILILILFLSHARETPPPAPNLTAPPPPDTHGPATPFRPGIPVVVCVLTTLFSLTSLMLLYIKHCNGAAGGNATPWTAAAPLDGRKNSGIERSVVESLPVFRFGALRGQKEGLDCAVCLTRFEAAEVLRLLPKCKHAFHVECVDTWLDAHSTCPLCRYRVDPEDVLLVEDAKKRSNERESVRSGLDLEKQEMVESHRRHSSVGERETQQSRRWTASFRRSLDSATSRKKNNESVGCFVRTSARKDGMLLTQETEREGDRTSVERRLEHRIIVSPGPGPGPVPVPVPLGVQQRWSDVLPSDLLYLTSEMIMSEAHDVRGFINSRSVSEITGFSRFSSVIEEGHGHGHGEREREEGLVKRWLLGWISKS